MSRLFEALSNMEVNRRPPGAVPLTTAPPALVRSETNTVEAAPLPPPQELERDRGSPDVTPRAAASLDVFSSAAQAVKSDRSEPTEKGKVPHEVLPNLVEGQEAHSVRVIASPEPRLVASTNPNSLGAEKFRALVTRLDHIRKQRDLKSFQVTSSVVNEGKTLVAGNVAVTLAKYSGSKTLLIEGDLHRPTLASLLGLRELHGIGQWWSGQDQELAQYVRRLDDVPLWFLPAGKP